MDPSMPNYPWCDPYVFTADHVRVVYERCFSGSYTYGVDLAPEPEREALLEEHQAARLLNNAKPVECEVLR